MVLKQLYIFIMDLSTNQNNCMVHTLNYSMLQLHSQYAHTLHILKHLWWQGNNLFLTQLHTLFTLTDVTSVIRQYSTDQYSTAGVQSSFSSYEKELSEFHGCHHYRPVDGLNPDDWWRWGRRPRGRHSWAKPGAARAGATATPCNHYRAALGGQMTAQTHFNRYLNGRPTNCRKSGL